MAKRKTETMPERRRAARVARDLYGDLLGATSQQGMAEARTDFLGLEPGEQRFVLAQLGYLQIRAVRDLTDAVTALGTLADRIERWAGRHDRRESARGRSEAPAEREENAAPEEDDAAPEGQQAAIDSDHPALRVTCPQCNSGPGALCATRAGRTSPFHADRVAAAAAPTRTVEPDEILGADGARI